MSITPNITIRLDKELIMRLDDVAVKRYVNRTVVIKDAIVEYLNKLEQEKK